MYTRKTKAGDWFILVPSISIILTTIHYWHFPQLTVRLTVLPVENIVSHTSISNSLPNSKKLLFTIELHIMLLKQGTRQVLGGKIDFIVVTTCPYHLKIPAPSSHVEKMTFLNMDSSPSHDPVIYQINCTFIVNLKQNSKFHFQPQWCQHPPHINHITCTGHWCHQLCFCDI